MMKSWMIAGAGALLVGAAGVAVAQSPPAAPPAPPAAEAPQGGRSDGPMHERMGGHMGGHMGERMERHHGWRHHMPPPPPGEAAFFRFKKGDASVMIKCAEDEPMNACVDAASTLLDKLVPSTAR